MDIKKYWFIIKAPIERGSDYILEQLRKEYPGKSAFDLDWGQKHFVCEIEPTQDHPEFDRAVEVIILSKPHKHLKTTQHYKIISGTLELHLDKEIIILNSGDTYTIEPNTVHWAKSENECWVEIYSKPGWTKDDHILVDN